MKGGHNQLRLQWVTSLCHLDIYAGIQRSTRIEHCAQNLDLDCFLISLFIFLFFNNTLIIFNAGLQCIYHRCAVLVCYEILLALISYGFHAHTLVVYLVVCVWVHWGCLHAEWGLRRLDYHIVQIVATRRCGSRFRTMLVGDVLFGSGDTETIKEVTEINIQGLGGGREESPGPAVNKWWLQGWNKWLSLSFDSFSLCDVCNPHCGSL